MLITLSLKKSLIVEEFQGNYLKLNHELSAVPEWMKSNRLALSIVKTSFILFHSKKTETL